MTKITHWAWNGISYYPSNTPRVQRGLGNILFPIEENGIKVNLKKNASGGGQIEINPLDKRSYKNGQWKIQYLNSEPLMVFRLESSKITLKRIPSKTETLVNSDEKIEYKFYVPNASGKGYIGTLNNHLLIYYEDADVYPYVGVSNDPDIYLFLSRPEICIAKLNKPNNAYPP